MARIVEVHKGADGFVRFATFKYFDGKNMETRKTHLRHLVRLPYVNSLECIFEDNEETKETSGSEDIAEEVAEDVMEDIAEEDAEEPVEDVVNQPEQVLIDSSGEKTPVNEVVDQVKELPNKNVKFDEPKKCKMKRAVINEKRTGERRSERIKNYKNLAFKVLFCVFMFMLFAPAFGTIKIKELHSGGLIFRKDSELLVHSRDFQIILETDHNFDKDLNAVQFATERMRNACSARLNLQSEKENCPFWTRHIEHLSIDVKNHLNAMRKSIKLSSLGKQLRMKFENLMRKFGDPMYRRKKNMKEFWIIFIKSLSITKMNLISVSQSEKYVHVKGRFKKNFLTTKCCPLNGEKCS